MLVIYPNTPFWIGARAQGYSNNGEYGLAVDDLTKCIQLLPDPGFYNNRGIAYLKMGEYELAINDFSESIILDPTDSRGYNNRGNVYNAIGEFEKAQLDYSKAESLGW
jgi:tetratricopeptide (TPR) repeat protein